MSLLGCLFTRKDTFQAVSSTTPRRWMHESYKLHNSQANLHWNQKCSLTGYKYYEQCQCDHVPNTKLSLFMCLMPPSKTITIHFRYIMYTVSSTCWQMPPEGTPIITLPNILLHSNAPHNRIRDGNSMHAWTAPISIPHTQHTIIVILDLSGILSYGCQKLPPSRW